VSSEAGVSVVVASHARRLRLRWLLNALEEQTFAEPWEVVVVHDYDAATAERVIERHPLAAAGTLRHIAIEPGTGSPARQRNIGWRAVRGELVAFTDDDCRPDARWLEELVTAARRAPGAAVQGATRPDPLEWGVGLAPHVRSLLVDPVNAYRQTANMLYPRDLLERLGGFDEVAITGEDVDLSLRAEAARAAIVPAAGALVYHAVESHPLPSIMRQNWKWRHLAYLVKKNPEFRREMPARLFFDEQHMRVSLAAIGLAGARRHRAWLALAAPYTAEALGRRGTGPRARATAAAELPGQFVRQFAEVVGLAIGSARHRTLVL
jgi:GT2 family glycosyltransferase